MEIKKMTTLNQNMKEIIERVIKNKQLEEFLNNEKILSLKQEDLLNNNLNQ